jgi:hypothetical protein
MSWELRACISGFGIIPGVINVGTLTIVLPGTHWQSWDMLGV